MEPISIVTGVIGIGDRVYKLAKNVKDHEIKHQLDEIGDELRDLKQSASKLEDENRELREKLRFKSEAYEFRNPFWYDKAHPDRPLCPKCHAKQIDGPVGELDDPQYRSCLVCGEAIRVDNRQRRQPAVPGYGGNKTPRDISDLDPDF